MFTYCFISCLHSIRIAPLNRIAHVPSISIGLYISVAFLWSILFLPKKSVIFFCRKIHWLFEGGNIQHCSHILYLNNFFFFEKQSYMTKVNIIDRNKIVISCSQNEIKSKTEQIDFIMWTTTLPQINNDLNCSRLEFM